MERRGTSLVFETRMPGFYFLEKWYRKAEPD